MRINTITKTQTQEIVVRTEYIAEDGTVFYNEEECKKYEESALFVLRNKLKRLNTKSISVLDLFGEGSDEDEAEVFDIQTEADLDNLKQYIALVLKKNKASDESVKEILYPDKDEYGVRFGNVTCGHEVIVCWSYDKDWAWTYFDGSLNGYFEYVTRKYIKHTTTETKENK